MTEQEAREVLRRFQNWRTGKDCRVLASVFPESDSPSAAKVITKAIEAFASKDGVIDCENCIHSKQICDVTGDVVCGMARAGKCEAFEEKQES